MLCHFPSQTGSFRVDSRGRQQGVKEKRYAGSEVHLTELLETVCDLMQNYGVSTDSAGRKSYMRINSRDGETITISNMSFSSDGSRDLTSAVSPSLSQSLPSLCVCVCVCRFYTVLHSSGEYAHATRVFSAMSLISTILCVQQSVASPMW